ncbi:MAG: hypothetical protein AAGE52_12715 [Myxococcota bacterium]
MAVVGYALLLILTGCLRDIRPDSLREHGFTENAEERGRQVLRESAEAHGIARWRETHTVAVRMRDDWDSVIATVMGVAPDWDVEDLLDLRWGRGTFDGSVVYLNGDRRGDRIGLQNWRSYEARSGTAPQFHEDDDQDEDTAFIIPAVVYLLELPYRLPNAPVIAYVDEQELFGRRVHRVLAAWEEEPTSESDQFLVSIDAETHLLTMAEYTVRDQFGFARGTSTFTRYQRVHGIQVPRRMAVTTRPRENHDNRYTHRMVMWNWRFDEIAPEAVWPNPALGRSEDAKND